VKLADFGLAKKFGTQSASHGKSFVGTILYSCPEIVQSKPYSHKCDIWSLGAILYELLTFQHPFKAENPLHIAKKIVDCDYERIKPGEYSDELIKFVELCMTADTKKRPNANECLNKVTPKLVNELDELTDKCLKYEKLQSEMQDSMTSINDPTGMNSTGRKTHTEFKNRNQNLRLSQ
jgi:NIMA (never in mitosis gene a)-related kinase 10